MRKHWRQARARFLEIYSICELDFMMSLTSSNGSSTFCARFEGERGPLERRCQLFTTAQKQMSCSPNPYAQFSEKCVSRTCDADSSGFGFTADFLFEFQETFGGLVNQLRMVNRDDASAINVQIHFDRIVGDTRSHLSVAQMDGLPSHYARVVGEHFDSRVRETAEWLTAMDANSFCNFVNTHATPRGRGANILPMPRRSIMPNDLSSFRDSDPSYCCINISNFN